MPGAPAIFQVIASHGAPLPAMAFRPAAAFWTVSFFRNPATTVHQLPARAIQLGMAAVRL